MCFFCLLFVDDTIGYVERAFLFEKREGINFNSTLREQVPSSSYSRPRSMDREKILGFLVRCFDFFSFLFLLARVSEKMENDHFFHCIMSKCEFYRKDF